MRERLIFYLKLLEMSLCSVSERWWLGTQPATVVAGFCLLAVSGEPEPEAGTCYVGGHHSYHPVVVHPGYYDNNRYGRNAEPNPEADAEPGFRGRGYGYQSRPHYHGYSHLHKRSAEPEPDAEPGYPYGVSSPLLTTLAAMEVTVIKSSSTVQPM